ncbi:MAG TPA: alpha/beta fold hydrolase [Bryobacteraceae bacterium]|nr:alpha/beta fold hydrolase [Bryobacteraceae bacterium]
MARRIESHALDGPAGMLEALLEEPDEAPLTEACVVCHPHPLFGGTMHNKVVYRIARALRRRGTAVLRFNFRGVGRSAGAHAEGVGEIEDARATLAWLRARYPDVPYALAGFSFGARVILSLGCSLGDVRRLIAAGVPTGAVELPMLTTCTVPKFFVSSTHDQYAPAAELEALVAAAAAPKQLIWIDAADHFFAGALDALEEAVLRLG